MESTGKLLTYRELPGCTAVDIAECVKQSFAELDIDLSGNSRLVCYGADGASVMGTRRAFGLPGNNDDGGYNEEPPK